MVLIPGGTFTMGSPDDELDRLDSESPQHSVTVPQFFMGRYPITQAQYQAIMDTNPATRYEADRFVASDKPVVGVTWHDAVEFCDRLSKHTDRPYRLPSEAESRDYHALLLWEAPDDASGKLQWQLHLWGWSRRGRP